MIKGVPPVMLRQYVDGKVAVQCNRSIFADDGLLANVKSSTWEMQPDGTLQFLGVSGDSVKRYRVTPAPDMSVAQLVTDIQTAEVKAEADKRAAAEKAAADAAQRKADAEAARQKAAQDAADKKAAAAAARQAARDEAAQKKAAAKAAKQK
jgi:hypothetical protein